MRFSTFSAIATFAATALAQFGDLPTCGTACVGNGLAGTGCNTIDVACICNSAQWISELSCCVSQACEPADQQAIIQFAQGICQPVGVTNLPTSAGCTGSTTPSATGSATGSGGALSSAAATASNAVSSGLGAISSAASSAAAEATGSGNAASAPTAFALPMGVAAAAGLFAAAL